MSDKNPGGLIKISDILFANNQASGMVPSNIAGFNPAYGAAAPGVWTLDQAQYFTANRLWPIYDPYYNLTTLMLPGNGTNGAQNNTFLDSSTNNFTITRNGNTTQGTFSPFSQTGWSNFFDGSGDHLSVPTGSALSLTGDFTVEAWVYQTTAPSFAGIFSNGDYSASSQVVCGLSASTPVLYVGNGTGWAVGISSTVDIALNTWAHLAFTCSGSTFTLWVNGVSRGTATYSGVRATPLTTSSIGRFYAGQDTYYINGYLSNVRVVKGTAVYTSTFTPPTAPLTAITNTSLLTCQSNRFIDNSASPLTITANGNTSVLPFSPFAPTAAYSAATVGGSGYFAGGSTNNLTLATNAAFNITSGSTDSFICELWVNWSTVAANQSIVDNGGVNGVSFSNWAITTNASSQIAMSWGDSGAPGSTIGSLSTTIVPTAGTWFHIALVKTNADWALFINGTRATSFSGLNTATKSSASALQIATGIGSQNSGNYFSGYISGLRIYKGASGSAPYAATSTTITVPTAPPTAITNTSLLMNYTNAGIIDATADNVLQTVGNAQISTTQSKFGGSSIFFDGNGDYLQVAPNTLFDLRTSDFTIEFWIYPTSFASATYPLYSQFNRSSTNAFAIEINTSGTVFVYVTNSGGAAWSIINAGNIGTLTLNAWNHVAFVRNGSAFRGYVNGTQGSLSTNSSNTIETFNGFNIGATGAGTSGYFTGYMDDFRIARFARYTANFTPPTSALQQQ